jgi:hypothetical protein
MILRILFVFLVQAVYALQIEAPQEIAEAVLAYSKEAGAENRNAILKISTVKDEHCDAFTVKLISLSDGKTLKEALRCITEQPNVALQNGVFEVFGHLVEAKIEVSGGVKTALMGTAFVAAGLLLYYSKPPKPVYKYENSEISEVAK